MLAGDTDSPNALLVNFTLAFRNSRMEAYTVLYSKNAATWFAYNFSYLELQYHLNAKRTTASTSANANNNIIEPNRTRQSNKLKMSLYK